MTHGPETSAFNGWMSVGQRATRIAGLEHLENLFNAAPCAVHLGSVAAAQNLILSTSSCVSRSRVRS